MGILNLTPDSFSDGGDWLQPERAVAHGLAMLADGAEILDLGAESSRPGGGVYGEGAAEVSADEELERLLPVLEALRRETEAVLSVDTRKGEVAERALAAGADLINDVTALSEPGLGRAVRDAGCPLVLMHSRGDRATMQAEPHYDDLMREIAVELGAALDRATAFGIDSGQVILDPGDRLRQDLPAQLRGARPASRARVSRAPPLGGSVPQGVHRARHRRCAALGPARR